MNASPTPGVAAWTDRVRAWHLVLLCLLLYLPILASTPLAEPDEGRYAEIPREMLSSGDFVTPRLNGVLYFEKPVFYYWAVAGAEYVLGQNELAARSITLLSGLLGVLLTFYLGTSMGSRRLGVYGAAILAVSPLWATFSRVNTIDLCVSVWITATLAAFWWASRDGAGKKPWYALFAASALAVLTKGLIGMVLPGGVIFVYLLLSRRWKLLLRVPWITGTLLFAAIAVPWHVLVAQRNPSFLWFYFVHEHFLRYTTDVAERTGPAWYYLPVLLVGLLPWSGLLPASWRLFRAPTDAAERDATIFLGSWAALIVLFFSTSKSKLIPYVLPAWPALALLAAMVLIRVDPSAKGSRGARIGLAVTTPVLLLVFGGLAWGATGAAGPKLGQEMFFSLPLLLAATAGALLALAAFVRLLRGSVDRALLPLLLASMAFIACLVIAGQEVMKGRTAKGIAQCIEALDDGRAVV
ncbi:MAG: glycosyltransferase family 39 protein, partial [Acidobacteria bacterium]|nr:glycosyltransferase family 39 protein [Acidobacteriota bacterium]